MMSRPWSPGLCADSEPTGTGIKLLLLFYRA